MLLDPNVLSSQEKCKKIMKEQKSILPIVEKYSEYKKCEQTIKEDKELLGNSEKEFIHFEYAKKALLNKLS